jgi:hypothetical protein
MTPPPSLPPDVFDALPPAVQAYTRLRLHPLTLRGGAAPDSFRFGGTNNDLGAIDGLVSVHGGGSDELEARDPGLNAGATYKVGDSRLDRFVSNVPGSSVDIDFDGVEIVSVFGGKGGRQVRRGGHRGRHARDALRRHRRRPLPPGPQRQPRRDRRPGRPSPSRAGEGAGRTHSNSRPGPASRRRGGTARPQAPARPRRPPAGGAGWAAAPPGGPTASAQRRPSGTRRTRPA